MKHRAVTKHCPKEALLCSHGGLGDSGVGPVPVPSRCGKSVFLRLASWLDILHKQEFERRGKKHYIKYLSACSFQARRKKMLVDTMYLGDASLNFYWRAALALTY